VVPATSKKAPLHDDVMGAGDVEYDGHTGKESGERNIALDQYIASAAFHVTVGATVKGPKTAFGKLYAAGLRRHC